MTKKENAVMIAAERLHIACKAFIDFVPRGDAGGAMRAYIDLATASRAMDNAVHMMTLEKEGPGVDELGRVVDYSSINQGSSSL